MTGCRRLLIVTPDFPPARGGIQTLMGKLAEHLPNMSVRVVTLDEPGALEFDRRSGVDIRRTHVATHARRIRMAMLCVAAIIEAARFRADVVLVGHVAAFPAAAAVSHLLRIPNVLYVHADEFRIWPRRCTLAVRNADGVIAVSRHSEEMALAGGAAPDRVHRILNAVDVPFTGTAETKPDGSPTVLTIARMSERYKGYDVMLRAMPLVVARVPNARWVVIGDGPLRESYEQRAAALGISEAVTFTGALSDGERDEWLRRARVFAMPARLPPGGLGGEGFGIVYLEAAAYGLPVVAGREGGAVDAIDPGRSGLLVDPSDHVAVANAVADLLEDPERASAMGQAGRAWAAGFSWQSTAAKVAEVLGSVVDTRRATV